MRLCLFDDNRLGLVLGDEVRDVTAALDSLPAARYPLPRHDLLVAGLDDMLHRIEAIAAEAPRVELAGVKLRAPVANPGKIVAAPINYKAHYEEALAEPGTFFSAQVRKIQEMGLFLKATSSVIGPSEPILLRHPDRRTDHEVELAVIIGRRCNKVPADEAMRHVAGYCIGLDITVRGPEERSFRKSIDSYTVLGPWMVTAEEVPDPSALAIALEVDGVVKQQANTRDLLLDIPALIAFASAFYTLHPGDVLLTGTPAGVAPIQAGQVIRAKIEGVGEMSVMVATADA